MPKKYQTSGRTLYNHRGRFGRLTLIPSSKSERQFIACDTYATALRAMRAEFDPNVIALESEPEVLHEKLPTGKMHLDLREVLRDGGKNFVEVKDKRFLSPREAARQALAKSRIEERGDRYELVGRDEVLASSKAKSFQFLYRYLKWHPSLSVAEAALAICSTERVMPRTEWIRHFKASGLNATTFYWSIAKDFLHVVDDGGLFPDGYVRSGRQ